MVTATNSLLRLISVIVSVYQRSFDLVYYGLECGSANCVAVCALSLL